jgi:sensor c-di-GMP phosphodiesterase-like protein
VYHVVTHESDHPEESDETEPAEAEPGEQKKERVLHTRIPAVLEAELKATARALRVPVSNLVRTILEDAVTIADRASEKVEDRLSRAARTMHDERGRLRRKIERKPIENVVAYQPVVMAVDSECVSCSRPLREGDDAGLAVGSVPGPPRFVCTGCMPQR